MDHDNILLFAVSAIILFGRENLKIGSGLAYNTGNMANDDQMLEVVIVVATVPDSSESDCLLNSVAKVIFIHFDIVTLCCPVPFQKF